MINTIFIAQDGFFPLRIRDNVEGNKKQTQYSNWKYKKDLACPENYVWIYNNTND